MLSAPMIVKMKCRRCEREFENSERAVPLCRECYTIQQNVKHLVEKIEALERERLGSYARFFDAAHQFLSRIPTKQSNESLKKEVESLMSNTQGNALIDLRNELYR